jgi:type II secretory ATPase GspE/PulE/Tfp pilus assembly ATPase PilB-like protein
MTGHLVFTSLHTHTAVSSIARLTDMGVEPGLIASSINCIVAQRLARRICSECREEYAPSAEDRVQLGEASEQVEVLYRGAGCSRCAGTGYRGRAAMYEVMTVQGDVRKLIAGSTKEIFAAAVRQGMTTLRKDGIRLCAEGVSTLDEIRRVTGDRLA